MKISTIAYALIVALGLLSGIAAAAPQPVATDRIEDVTMQILVEGGKLLLGANHVVLELRSSAGTSAVSDVVLTATRSGAPAESVGIDLSPNGGGRFQGTITLPWTGSCRLDLAWRDEDGYHSRDFVVPVVTGHH
jgi:hypothetical protein